MGPKKVSGKVHPKKIVVKMMNEEKKVIFRKHGDGVYMVDMARLHNKCMSISTLILIKKK